MIDWQAVETEYITTKTSYRKLAERYGVDQATVSKRGSDGKWVEKRKQHNSETQAKVLAADTRKKVSRAEKLHSAADSLLDKVTAFIEACDPQKVDAQALKHISGVLKDIKDVQMIRHKGDIQEQQARIDKLRADAAKGDKDIGGGLTVTLEGTVSEYGE